MEKGLIFFGCLARNQVSCPQINQLLGRREKSPLVKAERSAGEEEWISFSKRGIVPNVSVCFHPHLESRLHKRALSPKLQLHFAPGHRSCPGLCQAGLMSSGRAGPGSWRPHARGFLWFILLLHGDFSGLVSAMNQVPVLLSGSVHGEGS